jgi:hypothetical protein
LFHQPSAIRAESKSQGDFLLSGRCSRQEEIRDIGAGDEKNERDCA